LDIEDKKNELNVQADNNSIAIGSISAGGNIGNFTIGNVTGYSAEEVSVLITQIKSTFQPKPFDGRCPYKGLDVFDEEDAELFFGREKLVEDLVNRVKDSRTVFVTGPSGSGKSSLVRAGLLHTLRLGAVKESHSERWLYATMKPGRDPIGELSRVTAGLANSTNAEDEIRAKAMTDATIFARWCEIVLKDGRDKRIVLFIDQFEEVFTQISKDAERNAFLNLLTHAATVENGRAIILFSMRSDFVSNCATYPQLNALLNQQFIQIGAMQPGELVSAIAQPALRVGLQIDPDLIAQIISDMKNEPGSLPLMQFALKDLFEAGQTRGGVVPLTLNDYLQRGGIQKSLQRHSDAAFAKLDANEQELARGIFGGLIEIGRGTQDTRRTALFNELVPANTKAEDVKAVIQKLADARLVTTDEQAGRNTVTISHEKLIDAWPWLKKLVNENRDVLALQNEISADAKEWDEHKRDASYLYTGARLINAREKLGVKHLVLSGSAFEFVKAGQARQQRGRVALISGISTIIGLLVIAVIVFSSQSNKNSLLAREARLRELSSQSALLIDRRLQTSLLLGVEVFNQLDIPLTRGVLLDNLRSHPQLRQILSGHTDGVKSVAFSPDGKTLASGSADSSIILWDMATNQPIGKALTGHTGIIFSVAFSPDGRILASGSKDGTIILWDMNTHQPIGQPLTGHSSGINSVTFSPDGKLLASGSDDDTIILWDVGTHQPLDQPLTGHSGAVNSVAFSPDGRMLASTSTDQTIILWDVGTRQPLDQPLTGHKGTVLCIAFSPDARTLVSGSNDNTIIQWDVSTRELIRQLRTHSNQINSIAFSPDGKTFVSASDDTSLNLWDSETGRLIHQPLTGHSSRVKSVTFSPDGKTLASGSDDNTVILWDVEARQLIAQPLPGSSTRVNSVAFSPDGNTLASANQDNTIILWDVTTRQPLGQPLVGHTSLVKSVAFSPDGKTLASGSYDHTVILWDMATSKPIGQPFAGHSGSVNSVAFSPDGKILASGSSDNSIILWDLANGQQTGLPLAGHTGSVNTIAFSPDGKTLASGSSDATIILWDMATHQLIGEPLTGHTGPILGIAFSPDGKTLASGSGDSTIKLWDVTTRQPIGQPLSNHTAAVASLAFSPDGNILASSGNDKIIILWDVSIDPPQPIGQPLTEHTGGVLSLAFNPDGKILASGSIDNNIFLNDINPQSWIAMTCQRAGRNLTQEEWKLYFGDEKYSITCPEWPAQTETTSLR
jgi:WD40 repeat protein